MANAFAMCAVHRIPRAKYSLESKRNPQKRKAFKQKIEKYLKIEKETPERLQVWFWDGAFKVDLV